MFSDVRILRHPVAFQLPPSGKVRGGYIFQDSRCDAITAFLGRSVSNWTVALKNWNTTRDSEDAGRRKATAYKARTAQTPCRPVKVKHTYLDMMDIDTINL